jgi:transposase-like protein
MRYPASEKLEIIRLVEESTLPVRRTLERLGIPRATFYRWYDLYQTGGPEALADRRPEPDRVWNRIPDDFANASSRLRSMSPRCRRVNWPCGSPTPKAILSRRHRSIGCSRREV